jgi:ABC-2 type transport system permease protein
MSGSARRIWLVTRREWDQRARTRAFAISTIVSVVIVAALIMVPEIFGGGDRPTRTVGVVGESSEQLPARLRASGDQLDMTVKTRAFAGETAGRAGLRSGEVSVLLVDQQQLLWKAEPDEQLRTAVTSAVGVLERQQAIREIGLTPGQAKRLLQPPELGSTSLEPVTKEQTARADLGRIGVVLLFMAIAFYCGFVLIGVVEEKSSRVVEVLLSRVRPTELLAGKILGIGLVGLAQLAVVMGAGLVALRVSHNNTLAPETAPATLVWIVFWFILGYAFYSVLYATAGSLVSRQEETQSLQLPMTGLLFIAYILAFVATDSPDGAAALIGSLFPPTAPMVMIVRNAHGAVPWWQIVLSVALMVAAVYALVQAAGRIYAGGALRFGGRLRLREAWRGAEA